MSFEIFSVKWLKVEKALFFKKKYVHIGNLFLYNKSTKKK